MASLKDMRVRIASTKATQKITKAMQMVAASKLRRAQAAAEAARPYAERMEAVLGNIAAAWPASISAPRLLAGTGSDKVHLLVVCTGERGLCGAFNSSIVRLAREHANALLAEGKEVKILCVGRRATSSCAASYEQADRRASSSCAACKHARLRQCRRRSPRRSSRCSSSGEFDVATLFYLALQVGDLADPDRAADHPAGVRGEADDSAPAAVYEYEPEEDEILAELLPRNLAVQMFRALLENAASEHGARCARWTTRPATPAK